MMQADKGSLKPRSIMSGVQGHRFEINSGGVLIFVCKIVNVSQCDKPGSWAPAKSPTGLHAQYNLPPTKWP